MVRIGGLARDDREQLLLPMLNHSLQSRLVVLAGENGNLYEALADTGATVSCIDQAVVTELNLPYKPETGPLELAHAGATAVRIGTAGPVRCKVFFLNSDLPPLDFTHFYEILPLPPEHQFIFGTDLLGHLFPRGVPSSFHRIENSLSRTTPIIHSITRQLEGHSDGRLIAGLHELHGSINDSGAGSTASYEIPVHAAETSTTPSVEAEYAKERARVLRAIQPLLETNSKLTGFCNLPESIFELHVDVDQRSKLFRRQYPIPRALEDLAHEVIMRWLHSGKITFAPPNCPYNNPITVAPKRDPSTNKMTGIRVCLDTRALNAALILTDKFPLPNIPSILERFAGCSIFGEFDLSEAYLQLQLHPDSQPFTAFTWRGVQYMFKGCPFGLAPLPGFCQRVVSIVFRGCDFTEPYLDNTPVGSRTWDEHITHCSTVLLRLNQANLQVKISAVKVGQSQLRLLGHLLSRAGIAIDPEKLNDLKSWPPPATGKQMQQFLGFVQFLRSHVRHFAELTAPLEAVKNHDTIDYTKNSALINAFNLTRQALWRAPFLQYPDFDLPFHVATDASNTGVGAVLFQPRQTDEYITPTNIVSICSKILSPSQRNYPAYKKELFAIVYALRKFHYYIWGRADTVIITDHKPLTFILTSKQLAPALEQWLDVILNYQFRVVHRPGIMHVIPDQLSRMYADTYESSPNWGIPLNGIQFDTSPRNHGGASVTEEQSSVISTLSHKPVARRSRIVPPSISTIQAHSESDAATVAKATIDRELQGFLSSLPKIDSAPPPTSDSVRDSKVVQLKDNRKRFDMEAASPAFALPSVLPTPLAQSHSFPSTNVPASSLGKESAAADIQMEIEMEKRGRKAPLDSDRIRLVHQYHLRGHFGRDAMYKKLYADGFWWPKMRMDIDEELRSCDACIRFVVTKTGYHPAESITALLPGDHWQLDCSTHMPESPEGYTAIFHMIDVCTGFTILRAIRSPSAEEVADKLNEFIAIFGPPKIIQSDNGPEFVNDVMRAFVKLYNIEHRFILPYNPRADGKVERSVGVTTMIIKKFLHGAHETWPLFLPFAQLTYNDKISSITGSSPFALMFGRRMNHFKDYASIPENIEHVSLDDWKTHQLKILSVVYPAVSERVRFMKEDMKRLLNKHRRQLTGTSIPSGAVVMIKDVQRQNKFEPKYVGPYSVIRRAQNGGYVLRDATGDILDRHVPADHIKIISKKPKPEIQKNVFVIDRISNHRGSPGAYEYWVEWEDPNEAASWIPQQDFLDDAVIKSYWDSKRE